jgi:hypothetical protein
MQMSIRNISTNKKSNRMRRNYLHDKVNHQVAVLKEESDDE